jgi:beta-lactamase class A
MRRAIAALLLLSLVSAAPAGAQEKRPYPWDKRAATAEKFARNRVGWVDWAVVTPDGRVRGAGIHARHRSASVVKAMLLVAYLNHGDVPGRSLRSSEKAFLRPMIIRSDNDAATHTRNIVGNAGLLTLARRVGMKDFATSPSWGSTQISPYDQTRFFYRLDSFIPRRHRGYARALLSNIIGSQRWGLPPAVPSGWRIYFKGGWLPPRVVNQVGLLERGDRHIAIAVFTSGDPSFGYGQKSIRGVAARLLARLNDFES